MSLTKTFKNRFNMRYILSLLLVMGLVATSIAQDDDFFLNDPDEQQETVDESTIFEEEDLSVYYDDIVDRRLMADSRVIEYEPLSEHDVMWQRRIWRVIDTREKINQPFRNEDRPFFTILQEMAMEGQITVFRDEKFKEAMDTDDLTAMLNRIDTTLIYDPETYEEQITITENPLDPATIQRYRVREVWFFDKKTSTVKVRILGIAPIQDKFDENTGEFLYEIPMFWAYYPKARYHLAKEQVVSDFNDVSRMSWYDLLELRAFGSYIYAESNSLGLRLKDLYPDSEYDRLLASEKIKQELFAWEHDLWSF